MAGILVGYARVSTDEQDLTAQRDALAALGVDPDRVYVDHGLTGTNRERPGLREALAACRRGDTLVVTKLDRLARSLPDARDIVEELTAREVRLSLGGSVHDPADPVGRLLFNVLAMVAEFESDLIRMRTREGMKVAKAKAGCAARSPSCRSARRPTSSSCTRPVSTRRRNSRSSSLLRGRPSTARLNANGSEAPRSAEGRCACARDVLSSTMLAPRLAASVTRVARLVVASRYIRALLLIAFAAFGVVLAARVAGVCDGIEHLAPALLLAFPLLAGRYVGEEKLVALAERFLPGRVVRVARLAARLPRAPRVQIARGGALLAAALAERGPPAVLPAR